MKLEPPLGSLVARCQTMCVPECCGIDAYDFSPLHIASYLTMHRGAPDNAEIRILRGQIEALRVNYGTAGASQHGATFDDLNQGLTAQQIDDFANELLSNIDVALRLIQQSDEMRYKNTESDAS